MPATGMFLGQDPKGFAAGDTNLHRYVGGGPTNGSDPTGMDLAMPSMDDYMSYLTNPSTMDTELQVGFYGSLTVAAFLATMAVSLLAVGSVAAVAAAGVAMAEEGLGAARL